MTDPDPARIAYLRAVGDGVTHGSALMGLEAAKARLIALLDAGDALVAAMAGSTGPNDPAVKAAMAAWEEIR